jgi:tetratricopeptide (TPR) repeat protein
VLKSKQLVAVVAVMAVICFLYSLDIKGLVKPKGDRGINSTPNASETINSQLISSSAKMLLNANLASQVTSIEDAVKTASGAQKLALQKQLVQKWDDVNQPAPAAFISEEIALAQNSFKNWLVTGDKFTQAYTNYKDSSAIPALVAKAILAYTKALAINAASLDAKTGLGVAYVTEGKNPMQGIQLLLGVVKQQPNNLKANMNLGLFSMKSGQFDKAVNRFKTVLTVQQSPEAYFYLATSYENLGAKPEAILAYAKSKELAADPGLTKFVDQKIKELNNK